MSSNLGSGCVDGRAESDLLRSDVSGILLLLMSAKFSLETHAAEGNHIDSLKRCINEIRKQYNLTERDLNEGIVWKEPSIDGTLRLLEYVQGEVRDRLKDPKTADELQPCIDRLTSSRNLLRTRYAIVRPLAYKKDTLALKTTLRRQ